MRIWKNTLEFLEILGFLERARDIDIEIFDIDFLLDSSQFNSQKLFWILN